MRRPVICMTALACCAGVHAQSSVSVFGMIDMGVARVTGGGAHVDGLVSGGNSINRLGFKGTEDLGGGYGAGFWFEGQVNSDTGQGGSPAGFDFMRRSTVSLFGPFGEVRLGREFDPSYLNMINFDTWGQRGFGAIETTGFGAGGGPSYVRNSNGVHYLLPPNLGGIYGSVLYALSEQPSPNNALIASTSSASAVTTARTGSYFGGRLGYAQGPLDIAVGRGVFRDAVRSVPGKPALFYATDYEISNLGVSYDFGFIKPMLFVQRETMAGLGNAARFAYNTAVASATIPWDVGVFRVAYGRYGMKGSASDFNKLSFGYVHYLSKRTALYVDYGHIYNKAKSNQAIGGVSNTVISPTPFFGGSSTGYSAGIRHAF